MRRRIWICLVSLSGTLLMETASAGGSTASIGKLYSGVADVTGEPGISKHIEKTSFADRWPLTRADAIVFCSLSKRHESLIIVIEGKAYALNAQTTANAAANDYRLEVSGERVPVEPVSQLEPLRETDKNFGIIVETASRIGCLTKRETGGID